MLVSYDSFCKTSHQTVFKTRRGFVVKIIIISSSLVLLNRNESGSASVYKKKLLQNRVLCVLSINTWKSPSILEFLAVGLVLREAFLCFSEGTMLYIAQRLIVCVFDLISHTPESSDNHNVIATVKSMNHLTVASFMTSNTSNSSIEVVAITHADKKKWFIQLQKTQLDNVLSVFPVRWRFLQCHITKWPA